MQRSEEKALKRVTKEAERPQKPARPQLGQQWDRAGRTYQCFALPK